MSLSGTGISKLLSPLYRLKINQSFDAAVQTMQRFKAGDTDGLNKLLTQLTEPRLRNYD